MEDSECAQQRAKLQEERRKEREEESDDEDVYGVEIGFAFDASLPHIRQTFEFAHGPNKENILKIDLECVDDEPGAVQSGHYVWPAAPRLARHLADNWENIGHKTVVELGAGCGLVGQTAIGLGGCEFVVFTDHDPGVLRLIRENLSRTYPDMENSEGEKGVIPSLGTTWQTEELEWEEEDAKDLLEQLAVFQKASINPDDEDTAIQIAENRLRQEKEETRTPRGAHLVLGSDVIYGDDVVEPLLTAANTLLARDTDAQFLMCQSFKYGETAEKIIDEMCNKFGLRRTILECQLDSGGTRLQKFVRIR